MENKIKREYWPNGQLKYKYQISDDGKVIDGYNLSFYENGKIFVDYFYKYGRMHGINRIYLKNDGCITCISQYHHTTQREKGLRIKFNYGK
jgi:antitoxin component YwqK of YwqJK toxin-antitoxin module